MPLLFPAALSAGDASSFGFNQRSSLNFSFQGLVRCGACIKAIEKKTTQAVLQVRAFEIKVKNVTGAMGRNEPITMTHVDFPKSLKFRDDVPVDDVPVSQINNQITKFQFQFRLRLKAPL